MEINNFQLALIGAGAAGVTGVWAYNAWQEYRQRKAAEKAFGGSAEDDVLIDTSSPEGETPAFERAPVIANEPAETRIEPVFTQPQPEAANDVAESQPEEALESAVTPPNDTPDEEYLDPVIEFGMAFPADQTVAALQIAWCDAKVELHKSIRWIGRDSGNGEWTEIDNGTDSNADHAFVAIQLADRRGAIEMNDLSAFCAAAERIAVGHGGQGGTPAFDAIVAHARALDDACAAVDIQIAIHVIGISGQSFPGTKLRGLLEARGLQLGPDGMFHLLDDSGKRLLSVANSGVAPFDREQMRTGTIADVTFWLDVPRVDNGGKVFDAMLTIARQLAAALDGVLVDDQRHPLGDNVLAGIRAKVVELQTQMTAHGIPAGGRRALRLFA